jgi:biopolymer transport protein TolR
MAAVTRKRRLMGEINVVPYIDVMLVLLIIFMVTAPMLSQGVKVDLPKAGGEAIEPDHLEALVLSIDRDGRFYLNLGNPDVAQSDERIEELASIALRREPERPVLVKADRTVDYGRVVEGMVLLQRSGAQKVGFATDPSSSTPPKAGAR